MALTVALLAAGAAAWLVVPGPGRAHPDPPDDGVARPLRWWSAFAVAVLVTGWALTVPNIAPAPSLFVVAATAAGVIWSAAVLVRRTRRRSRRDARRREVVDLCDGLVAELQAGQPPSRALSWMARSWPDLERTSALAGMGGDVPVAMRRAARRPGTEPLAQIAAGWQVAHRSGAGLADILDRLSRSLRDDEDVRREVSASLGPTRATGRLLAILPLFGLGLGVAMGADPLSVLLGSTIGSICLASGAALAVGGLFWVERIVDRADPW